LPAKGGGQGLVFLDPSRIRRTVGEFNRPTGASKPLHNCGTPGRWTWRLSGRNSRLSGSHVGKVAAEGLQPLRRRSKPARVRGREPRPGHDRGDLGTL